MSESVRHDARRMRFTLATDGGEARLAYRMLDARTMDAVSTYTPRQARGRGIAGRLVRAALDHARAEGWRVVATCWYVDGWIDRHPEYADLRAA